MRQRRTLFTNPDDFLALTANGEEIEYNSHWDFGADPTKLKERLFIAINAYETAMTRAQIEQAKSETHLSFLRLVYHGASTYELRGVTDARLTMAELARAATALTCSDWYPLIAFELKNVSCHCSLTA